MVNNPHDKLFKRTFGQPAHAADMLRTMLPPALARRLDFDTLKLLPGSFVDEALSERHSDLLYEVRVGRRTALVHLLFEHQSTVEGSMALRLLRYMVRIWTRWETERGRPLPPIIPCIVYHGDARWTASTAFEALFDLGDEDDARALRDHLPRFHYVLDDLSAQPDERIRARAMSTLATLTALLLKHARHRADLAERIAAWSDLVRNILQLPDGLRALEAFVRYTLEVNDHVTPQALERVLVAEVGDEAKEAVVTAAQRLIEQGLQQGLQQGRRELLLRQLHLKFGAPFPAEVVARIERGRGDDLDRWAERLLTAETLEQVFTAGARR